MKKQNFIGSAIRLVAVFGFLSSGILFSCNNDDNGSASEISATEAVDVVSSSLSEDSNGMAKAMSDAVVYASEEDVFTESPTLNCGQLYTETLSNSFNSVNYSYDYSVQRNAQLNCGTQNTAASLFYNADFSGTYDLPRMSSDDNATANWTVTGLNASETTAAFNGSYERNGTQVSKVRNMNTFASTLTYSLNNILVNKTTHQIVSGNATVAFIGTASTGNQYTYNGLLTFNGDGTATLELNGNTYTINL